MSLFARHSLALGGTLALACWRYLRFCLIFRLLHQGLPLLRRGLFHDLVVGLISGKTPLGYVSWSSDQDK
jgi:hypothetical protein